MAGTCYGMEMNVEKTEVMRISRQPFPVWIMYRDTVVIYTVYWLVAIKTIKGVQYRCYNNSALKDCV